MYTSTLAALFARALSTLALPAVAVALAIGVAGAPRHADAAPPFTWTVSASSTDPWENTAEPTNWLLELYVWLVPGDGPGFAASQFAIEGPGMQVLAVSPINGFLNIAVPPDCGWLYIAGGCPSEPVAAAQLLVLSNGAGSLCMSECEGTNCSLGCDFENYENSYVGFSTDGSPPCQRTVEAPCTEPVSVDRARWGWIKARYR